MGEDDITRNGWPLIDGDAGRAINTVSVRVNYFHWGMLISHMSPTTVAFYWPVSNKAVDKTLLNSASFQWTLFEWFIYKQNTWNIPATDCKQCDMTIVIAIEWRGTHTLDLAYK